MSTADTRENILACARLMVQANGYTALSFRDIAGAVGVKSSSVHYHFPTKGDLGAELARRYTHEMADYLSGIFTATERPQDFMAAYVAVFRNALANNNRMCMCGVMAAEYDRLPEEVIREVAQFSATNIAWLARALDRADKISAREESLSRAQAIYAAVEGAQLIARSYGDIARFDAIIKAYQHSGLMP